LLYVATTAGALQVNDEGTRAELYFHDSNCSNWFGLITDDSGVVAATGRDEGATGVRIYSSDDPAVFIRIPNVLDCRQIAFRQANQMFLTSTKDNSIVVAEVEREWRINIGQRRADINHINALAATEHGLMVGLNNRGQTSQIGLIPWSWIDEASHGDVIQISEMHPVSQGGTHTHDIEVLHDGTIAYCSSHDSEVWLVGGHEPLVKLSGFIRGIAQLPNGNLWVGESFRASRGERHGEVPSHLHLVTMNGEVLKTIELPKTGQINDILWVEDG